MLPLGIALILVALIVAGYSAFGVIGSAALVFAAGFMLLAALSMLAAYSRARMT